MPHYNCSVLKAEMEAKESGRHTQHSLQYACLRNKHGSCSNLKKISELTVEKLEKAQKGDFRQMQAEVLCLGGQA